MDISAEAMRENLTQDSSQDQYVAGEHYGVGLHMASATTWQSPVLRTNRSLVPGCSMGHHTAVSE